LAAAAAADLVQLRRGALATVQFSALLGGRWVGSVAAVAPAVDRQSGLGRVRLTLAIGEGPAPPVGLYGTAQIAIGTPRLGLLVPLPALRSRSDKEAELVVCGSDGVAHVRRVQLGSARALGKSGDSLIEVRSVGGPALAVGDRVAVEPVLGIGDGDKLELTPAGSSDGSSDGGSHD
jgi:multidrug efflux pump subunit AcrA (membrane-fusion protein)